jgi:RimJ/RimL family protein N-acetyltransferase
MSEPLDLRPTLLAGGVRLEPLAPEHRDGLARAADFPEVWAHMPLDASGAGCEPWFDLSLASAEAGREAIWAVRTLADGALVGSTRYLAIERRDRRLEIGHTWYTPAVWASQVNPACKLALMAHAFRDAWVQSGRAQDRSPQPQIAGGDRQARRHPRGRVPRPHDPPRRLAARFGLLLGDPG